MADGTGVDESDRVDEGGDLIELGAARPGRDASPGRLARLVHRVDRSPALIVVTVAVVVIAGNVGFVSWATRDDGGVSAADAYTALGLTDDQAACAAFADAESEVSDLVEATARPGGERELDALRGEVGALDAIADANPAADYRLLVGFQGVADASVRFLAGRQTEQARGLVSERLVMLGAAHDLCAEFGEYDTRTGEPLQ